MTKSPARLGIAFLIAVSLQSYAAQAADLNGAWANDETVCNKIFQKKKNGVSIQRNSDFYGSGFIVDGDKLRGKAVTCTIKSRKEDGPLVNIIAVCSSDIALSTVQFSLKTDGDNRLTRVFPGVPEMSMSYVRCSI